MRKIVALTLPLVALSMPAYAQECDANCEDIQEHETNQLLIANRPPHERLPFSITQIKTITVMGKLPGARSEITESVTLVEISGSSAKRIENALLSVPGLQQFRRSDARSANPTSQGVTLRGLGGSASSRALLILNGVPQADPFGGWISWPSYDAVNLASVRVRKGGGGVGAGPGAMAGIIELDSLQNQDRLDGSIAYGSRQSLDAKAAVMRRLGQGTLSMSANYARGNGFIPVIKSQRGSADRRAPYEQAGVAIRAVAPLSSDIELQASLRAFTDTRDRGFDFSDNQNSGADASIRVVNGGEGWNWSALGYIQLRDFANRFGAVSNDRSSVSLTLDQYSVPSTGLGARFELRPPVGDNAELRIGGDFRRTIGQTKENFFFTGTVPGRNRVAGGRTDTLGGFAELTLQPSDALTLTAGGRADHWSIAGGFRKEINIGGALAGSVRSDDIFTDRSGWEGTGRVGLAFQVSSALKLRAAAYQSWRLPTLNELYRPFRIGSDATAANELLAPERLKGAEVGVQYDGSDVKLSATGFVNRLNGAIANVTVGRGPGVYPGVGFVAAGGIYRQRQNLDAITSKGIEIDGSLQRGSMSLRAGYAYVDANVRASGSALVLQGLRPAQVPRHFASAGIEYKRDAFELAASLYYVSRQFEDDANTRALKDALTASASASYRITQKFRIELRGENIFDTQVQAGISAGGITERATPQTIWLGLSLQL
jgi:vitamin B12 transporter